MPRSAAVSAQRERYAEILSDFAGLLGHSLSRLRIGIAMSVAAPGSRRIRRILDQQRILCSKLNSMAEAGGLLSGHFGAGSGGRSTNRTGTGSCCNRAGGTGCATPSPPCPAGAASPAADVQSGLCGRSPGHPGTGTCPT